MLKRISFVFVFIFLIISLVSAQTLVSSANVSYDSDLSRALSDNDFANNLMKQDNFIGLEIRDDQILARVMVILKDNSGIEIIGTKEERADLINQKISWVEKQTEEVLKDYSDNGLILRGKTSGGFGAFITKETFNKLVNDTRVQEISWTDSKIKNIGTDLDNKSIFIMIAVLILLILLSFFLIFKNKKRKNILK